ncbi:GrpB family protein [Shimia sp. MMG029]|uniref:GrpB family protein n=1 Tax=Shimia sp. MMG029 TaxID=3021978 RepID=UPI0022FF3C48|nr:GrpB family protein [Shimia sp. MMG029]MDA5557151.1 GrpB family protein [Shimia sp. MMG029]
MVLVVEHDPAWAAGFAQEAEAIHAALGAEAIELHHIGSTSVPGLVAKPILDLLGEVADLAAVDAAAAQFEALGYEAMGELGIPGRRYFRKMDGAGQRSHHLHVFERGSAHVVRHLAFRGYLCAHPAVAADYGALKRALIAEGRGDWESYIDGKDAFVQRVEAEALAWAQGLDQS